MGVCGRFLSCFVSILFVLCLGSRSVFAEKDVLLPIREGRVKDIVRGRKVMAQVSVDLTRVSVHFEQKEIGFATFDVENDKFYTDGKPVLYVFELYNLDLDHYKGVGKLLVRALVNISLRLGCEGRVHLCASRNSHAFYLKYGFIPSAGNEFGRPARDKWENHSDGDDWSQLLKLYYYENRASSEEEEKQIRQKARGVIASALNQPVHTVDFDSYWPPVHSLAEEILDYAKRNSNQTGFNESMRGYGGIRMELTPKGVNCFKKIFSKMNLYKNDSAGNAPDSSRVY
jgi:hypothetical protein